MNENHCEACNGYGFDAFDEGFLGEPRIVIQRCDSCTEISDDAITPLVVNLAKAALDIKDILALYYAPENEESDFVELFEVVDSYRLAAWPEGRIMNDDKETPLTDDEVVGVLITEALRSFTWRWDPADGWHSSWACPKEAVVYGERVRIGPRTQERIAQAIKEHAPPNPPSQGVTRVLP